VVELSWILVSKLSHGVCCGSRLVAAPCAHWCLESRGAAKRGQEATGGFTRSDSDESHLESECGIVGCTSKTSDFNVLKVLGFAAMRNLAADLLSSSAKRLPSRHPLLSALVPMPAFAALFSSAPHFTTPLALSLSLRPLSLGGSLNLLSCNKETKKFFFQLVAEAQRIM